MKKKIVNKTLWLIQQHAENSAWPLWGDRDSGLYLGPFCSRVSALDAAENLKQRCPKDTYKVVSYKLSQRTKKKGS